MQLKRFPIALTILVPVLFLADACHHSAKPSAGTPAAPLVSPSGKTYARAHVAGPDDHEPFTIPPVPPGAAPNTDRFNGSARKAAKLSIASGTPQTFSDIGALLDTLPPDEQMRALHIDKGPDSGRIDQEQAVVTVTGFLYAAGRESDNDFHCIVGRDPSLPARFMNVEVSGLPAAGSEFFNALKTARNQFKTFFTSNGDGLPARGYDRYTPPIPITVTGSLFFDVDHIPPAVGPVGMRPETAWEIHPVSDIQFERQ